jgi:hypothetical protein
MSVLIAGLEHPDKIAGKKDPVVAPNSNLPPLEIASRRVYALMESLHSNKGGYLMFHLCSSLRANVKKCVNFTDIT